jgi:hypothetical protein
MLTTTQYQPRLSSITNVAPDGSPNQFAVFTSNKMIAEDTGLQCVSTLNKIILMTWFGIVYVFHKPQSDITCSKMKHIP